MKTNNIIRLYNKINLSNLIFSNNSEFIACISENEGIIIISNLFSDPKIRLLKYPKEITALTISYDSKYIFWGDSKGNLIGYDLNNQENFFYMTTFENYAISSLEFNPNGSLASVHEGEIVYIWNINTKKLIKKLEPKEKFITIRGDDNIHYITFTSDGKYLVTVNLNSRRIWNFENGFEEVVIFDKNECFHSTAASFDNNYIVFAKFDKLLIYNFYSMNLFKSIVINNKGWINGLYFSSNNKYLAYLTTNNKIQIVRMSDFKEFSLLDKGKYLSSIRFSNDSKYLFYIIEKYLLESKKNYFIEINSFIL